MYTLFVTCCRHVPHVTLTKIISEYVEVAPMLLVGAQIFNFKLVRISCAVECTEYSLALSRRLSRCESVSKQPSIYYININASAAA